MSSSPPSLSYAPTSWMDASRLQSGLLLELYIHDRQFVHSTELQEVFTCCTPLLHPMPPQHPCHSLLHSRFQDSHPSIVVTQHHRDVTCMNLVKSIFQFIAKFDLNTRSSTGCVCIGRHHRHKDLGGFPRTTPSSLPPAYPLQPSCHNS